MSDEPISVRVAHALGYTQIHQAGHGHEIGSPCGDILSPGDRWHGRAPGDGIVGERREHRPIPPYGEDSSDGWAATGPLIGRFSVNLSSMIGGTYIASACACPGVDTGACAHDWLQAEGASPCEAVAALLAEIL